MCISSRDYLARFDDENELFKAYVVIRWYREHVGGSISPPIVRYLFAQNQVNCVDCR